MASWAGYAFAGHCSDTAAVGSRWIQGSLNEGVGSSSQGSCAGGRHSFVSSSAANVVVIQDTILSSQLWWVPCGGEGSGVGGS